MFEMKTTLAQNANTDVEDQANIKTAMTALGYYDDSETGLSPYADTKLFHAVKDFQKDNDLKIDGIIKPDGPTQRTIKEKLQAIPQAAGAFKDFIKNYHDMRQDWTKNADKYFHCKENFEATHRGWAGKAVAQKLSNAREIYREYIKGDPEDDKNADQSANIHGRNAALSGSYKSAKEACSVY